MSPTDGPESSNQNSIRRRLPQSLNCRVRPHRWNIFCIGHRLRQLPAWTAQPHPNHELVLIIPVAKRHPRRMYVWRIACAPWQRSEVVSPLLRRVNRIDRRGRQGTAFRLRQKFGRGSGCVMSMPNTQTCPYTTTRHRTAYGPSFQFTDLILYLFYLYADDSHARCLAHHRPASYSLHHGLYLLAPV